MREGFFYCLENRLSLYMWEDIAHSKLYPPDHPILFNSYHGLIFVKNNFDDHTRENVCHG